MLVVEDEANLAETLRFNLEREGYDVHTAADGEAGRHLARTIKPDLILLDVMLPALSGTEVLRRLRAESNVPVLRLTARTAEIDRVQGLNLGADDYITKPFGLGQLLARVRAHRRRQPASLQGAELTAIRFGDLTLDVARHELRRGSTVVPLRPKE
ncbi:MAG: response regulator transcription factor, partial [Dehalococcoidia bacterium]